MHSAPLNFLWIIRIIRSQIIRIIRWLYRLFIDYTDYMYYTFEKNWTIFHIISITWIHKLYGLYIDYTDYTMHIIVIINISCIIKITCLYLQSCRSTRRSANTTHLLLLYKIFQDHMMVEYKILLCHHLQADNVLMHTCLCTAAFSGAFTDSQNDAVDGCQMWCDLLGTGMVSWYVMKA